MLLSRMERSSVRSRHNFSENRSNVSKSFVLPKINRRLDTESSINSSKITVQPKKIITLSQKIQKYRRERPSTEDLLPS
jgi:hypothetical protein